jgi:hypothetical protein
MGMLDGIGAHNIFGIFLPQRSGKQGQGGVPKLNVKTVPIPIKRADCDGVFGHIRNLDITHTKPRHLRLQR